MGDRHRNDLKKNSAMHIMYVLGGGGGRAVRGDFFGGGDMSSEL